MPQDVARPIDADHPGQSGGLPLQVGEVQDLAFARQRGQPGGKPFFDLALPEAVLRLKQGFGRLIRHSQDRGQIHILDSRVLGKSYGRAFLKALPPARVPGSTRSPARTTSSAATAVSAWT